MLWPCMLMGWCYIDTGDKVFLPFRMSCYVLTNLVVTAGMLTPGLGVRTLWLWCLVFVETG